MDGFSTSSTDGGKAGASVGAPQPTVIVSGSAGRLPSSVALGLLEARVDSADGAVLVVSEASPTSPIQKLTAEPLALDRDALVVVDCRQRGGSAELDAGRVRRVPPEGSALAVDREVRDGLDWLAEQGIERRHFLFDSLALGGPLPDADAVYDLAYELAMTVGAEDGLGAVVVDSDGLSTEEVGRLGHLFDVHVELERDETGPQMRWTGLLGGSDGWVPVEQVDFESTDFR